MAIKVEYIPVGDITPYENNPRKNDKAADVVAKSIKEFGFNVPIILDKDNIIIAGHTRLKAALKLGLNEVPVIWAKHLTEEQTKAFRIMDNKSGEYAEWDLEKLKTELTGLKDLDYDLDFTGFEESALDVLDIQTTVRDVPDVDIEGEIKEYTKVIVIVGMDDDEHEAKIREFLEINENQKTMKSFEFIDVLNKRGI